MPREDLKTVLPVREYTAYNLSIRKGEPPVADRAAEGFMQMYVAGATCQEIQRVNTGFSLGQIVRCRVDGDWDVLRAEYNAQLYTEAAGAVKQAQMESVKFLALRMAASHKYQNDRLLKFIQTGDEKQVDGLGIKDFKQYQETLETLLKVTGQDAKRIAVTGSVEHSLSEAVKGILTPDRAPTPQEAEIVLKGLLEGDNKKNDSD